MQALDLGHFRHPVFFIGAGMSAESGMPTYRGHGGIWSQYNFEEYACQDAFDRDPGKVLDFHAVRRETALGCQPHAGHRHLAELQQACPDLSVITQNTDGMLQRAGIAVIAELHGSLWRLRCREHGLVEDRSAGAFARRDCAHCGVPLRPDITWFGDRVDRQVFFRAQQAVEKADLFVSIGTSGVVWPAAGFAELARDSGAKMVEINPEDNEASALYELRSRTAASVGLPALFPLPCSGG